MIYYIVLFYIVRSTKRPYVALPDDLESAGAAASPRPQQLPQPPTQTQPRRTPPPSPQRQPLRPQQEVPVQDAATATSLVGQWCSEPPRFLSGFGRAPSTILRSTTSRMRSVP